MRAGVLTTDHATDGVGFRHALLREAAERELGPGARRAWHRRWAEVLQGSPGVLAADPAALAIAEHWHQARDVRRSFAATVAALPAARRICRPDEEVVLWTRVFQAFASLEDASKVAGFCLRDAYASALLVAAVASTPFTASASGPSLSSCSRRWNGRSTTWSRSTTARARPTPTARRT